MNCEYGVPLWCAEIISALRMYNNIELHIAMPYEDQSTNWVEEFCDRFFDLHARANSVEIVSDQYDEKCYNWADEHMIDDSDLLLVVGNITKKCYGAGYAQSHNISVEILDNDNFLVM